MNVIHTAKNISMLNVINLASLKLSGSFLAKNANKKHKEASRPIYPNTHQKPISDPTAHSTIIVALINLVLYAATGGLVVNHIMQISACTKVHKITLDLCLAGPNHFMTLLPGRVALNAIKTTTVFAKMHEIQRVKLIPKAGYRVWHNQSVGFPINVRPIRKLAQRNRRRRKLNSILFPRMTGVFLYIINTPSTANAAQAPNAENAHRIIPKGS